MAGLNTAEAVDDCAALQAHDTVSVGSTPSARPLRVCHVSMTLLTGGLERLLVDFGRHRNQQRFDCEFLALDGLGTPADDLRALGYPVASIADNRPGRLARLHDLVRRFREGPFDVVHTHNTLAHFYGATAARLAGVPVVVNSQHGRGCGRSWKARCQFRIANRWTDRIVGVSEDAAALCRRDDSRSAERIISIWNGIDIDRFDFRGPASQPTAISVARLSKEKDFGTLLRAVWILIKEFPDFRLKLVGDGAEREKLEALSRDLKLTGHVEFLGERHDIADLLPQAGFFVSSSITEGISLTILEAMAAGLPVATTNVGGNPEIVVEGGTGRLVNPRSPEELALAMRDLLNDRDAWPVMGQLGRQRIEQHFNVRSMVRQYEDLYIDLLRQKGRLAD
ncbi:MAG: glycosyltransferase [Planctomycetota bacterium]|jgi:glycosyltransferase involved in cell wall biosynthesis